jgi:hypothetical protein
MNKTFQLLEVMADIKWYITKINKTIEYFPSKVIKANNKIFNDMIIRKRNIYLVSK